MTSVTKVCSVCKENKPIDEFRANKQGRLGRHSQCKVCYKQKHPQKYDPSKRAPKDVERNYNLRRYGLTLRDYDKLLESQDYSCKLCGSSDPGGRGRFHVDHNHQTGKVRGLLCHHCNLGLGHLKDSPKLLSAGLTYLLSNGYYGDA